MEDLVFFGNIILFYTKAELAEEKAGHFLSEEQKSEFKKICDKMAECLKFTLDFKNSLEKAADVLNQSSLDFVSKENFKHVAAMMQETYEFMEREANKLGERNGSLLVIAQEYKSLASKVKEVAEQI